MKLFGSSGTLCLSVVPPNLDFGATKFGCATANQTVEVFNIGSPGCSKNITVTGFRIAPNPTQEFRIASAPPTPLTLNVGQSMRIQLAYKAKDLGVDNATLEIGNGIFGQSPILVPLVGEGVATSDQKDVFRQPKQAQVDVLFIIDDSSSTFEEQGRLGKHVASLVNLFTRLNVDYHMMVTTTDVTGGRFGAGCARGKTTKIVTPKTPDPAKTIAANMMVGTAGSGAEKGLEGAYRALTPPASTGCNKGFYRKDALLSMVFMSDEPDGSPQSVSFYLSFFRNLKGPKKQHLLRASAIVGPAPTGCRNPNTGSAGAGPRYLQVAKDLGGVQESVCKEDWSSAMLQVGAVSVSPQLRYYLSRQADPKTIRVKVNGKTIPNNTKDGWTYDTTNNAINLTQSQAPPAGATIQIEYKALCFQ